jgi:TPR repeat protein
MLGDLRRFDIKEPALAREAYRYGCDAGLTEACLSYGAVLMSGVGGPPDYPKAIRIFEGQCSAGDSMYCTWAGQTYVKSGIPQADAKAEPLLRKACDMNALAGCFSLGELMERKGGKPNRDAARALYVRACDARIYDACQKLKQ